MASAQSDTKVLDATTKSAVVTTGTATAVVNTASASNTVATAAPTTTFADDAEVPRNHVETAVAMILAAVKHFPSSLEDRLELKHSIDLKTMRPTPAFVVAYIKQGEKNHHRKHLSIWFNADDALTSGGRSVEIGWGPNYYTTFGELKEALQEALDSDPE
jgi:hypothetical protein